VGYTEAQLKNLDHIITNCSIYEDQFWDMAWTLGKMDR
jgi:thiaminase